MSASTTDRPSSYDARNREAPTGSQEPVQEGTAPAHDPCYGKAGTAPLDEPVLVSKQPGILKRAKDGAIRVVHTIIPPGGIMASAFNMASASIGAGILGLSSATSNCGVVVAMFYLLVITFFAVYAMTLLAMTAEKSKLRSFEGMGRWLFPRWNYAFSYWVAFIRWFHAFSSCVAYIISVGNCFHPLFKTANERAGGENSALRYLSSTSGNKLITSMVWLVIMLPMVIPKHIDTLRYASTFAVLFMIYFVIVIVVHSSTNGLKENIRKVKTVGDSSGKNDDFIILFRTGNTAVQGLGVFMFAYVCQINALEVYCDMPREMRTTKNYTLAAVIGMLICGILYALVCFFGYLDFGGKKLAGSSILLMYDPLAEMEVLVAYIGVMIKLCVAYALLTMAARNSLYYLMGWQQKYNPRSKVAVPQPNVELNNDSSTSKDQVEVATKEGSGEPQVDDDDSTYIDNIPFWKHILVVLALCVASLLCGLFIPNINTVFGFAGAISGGFMAFIFPALFVMYSGGFSLKEVGVFHYFATYLLLLTGVIGVVFGTAGTIYETVLKS